MSALRLVNNAHSFLCAPGGDAKLRSPPWDPTPMARQNPASGAAILVIG